MKLNLTNIPPLAATIIQSFSVQLLALSTNKVQGIYITGSLSFSDFYSNKSDIDFIVLLVKPPDDIVLKEIDRIHKNIRHQYRKPALNGFYITLEGLRQSTPVFPYYGDGKLQPANKFDLDQVMLLELMNTSLTVYGLPAKQLPISITDKDVAAQLHQNINSYWKRWISKHSSLSIGHLLQVLFPQLTEWGVLGVARQLYTLNTGKITSKLNAGQYCLDELPAKYHPVISTAMEIRKRNRTTINPSLKRSRETNACMKYIIEQFNQRYTVMYGSD